MASLLFTSKQIEDRINECIISEEEISDSASPKLKQIRRNIFVKNKQIREKLDSIVNSGSKYLPVSYTHLYLGKKGELTLVLREMGKLSKEERPVMGAIANEVREEIENELENKKIELENIEIQNRLIKERIDITLNKETRDIGHSHPLIQTLEALESLFIRMGFTAVSYTHLM